jgi:hypothetical protein
VHIRVPYKLRVVGYNAQVILLTGMFLVRCLLTYVSIPTHVVCCIATLVNLKGIQTLATTYSSELVILLLTKIHLIAAGIYELLS